MTWDRVQVLILLLDTVPLVLISEQFRGAHVQVDVLVAAPAKGIGMTISLFVNLLLNGLAMGMVYAMLGIGLILLIRAVGILNFAQGDLLMLGAFITSSLILDFELPIYVMIPLAFLMFILIGALFMFVVYWPLRKASYPAATIIATMGASIMLKESVTLIWGSVPRALPSIITDAEGRTGILYLGTVPIQWQYILIVLVGILFIVGITLLFDKLYIGKLMQAACQDAYAANLLGIPSQLTILLTYIIVAVVAGFGGYMVAPIYMVRNTLGTLQLRAFAGVVIGGLGSISGALIGSLIVGVVEVFSTMYLSSYKDVTVFILLILFLIFRPQGIFGERIGDKA